MDKNHIYYYRDKDAREIDIVLEHDGILNPLEIKKTSNPGSELTKVFALLDKASVPGEKVQFQNAYTGYSKCDGILIYGWVIDVPARESQILAELYLFLIRPLNCKNLTPFSQNGKKWIVSLVVFRSA